jgi:hypothetical protein
VSRLTKYECDALPVRAFADMERRLMPILDREDLTRAVWRVSSAKDAERVKRRIVEFALMNNWPLPKTWERDVLEVRKMFVVFNLTGAPMAAGNYVLREGKIFEAGSYPDKEFELSPEELQAVAATFVPVPIDLEHTPTVLDGKMGTLQSVRVSPDGRTLFGTVALPRWLDSLLNDGERKVSCAFHKLSKRLLKLSLVINPRVNDAALMAAFSSSDFAQRQDTPEGQSVMQMIHDMTARSGAVCVAPAGQSAEMSAAQFHSAHELKGIQELHDVTNRHGIVCGARQSSPYFSAAERSEGDRAGVRAAAHMQAANYVAQMTGQQTAPPAPASTASVGLSATLPAEGAELTAEQRRAAAHRQAADYIARATERR